MVSQKVALLHVHITRQPRADGPVGVGDVSLQVESRCRRWRRRHQINHLSNVLGSAGVFIIHRTKNINIGLAEALKKKGKN